MRAAVATSTSPSVLRNRLLIFTLSFLYTEAYTEQNSLLRVYVRSLDKSSDKHFHIIIITYLQVFRTAYLICHRTLQATDNSVLFCAPKCP
jgi:hypothetical protein